MGFVASELVIPILEKHKGDIPATLAELVDL
jgi:hypothetical protein